MQLSITTAYLLGVLTGAGLFSVAGFGIGRFYEATHRHLETFETARRLRWRLRHPEV